MLFLQEGLCDRSSAPTVSAISRILRSKGCDTSNESAEDPENGITLSHILST